jgi:hypothetical protein
MAARGETRLLEEAHLQPSADSHHKAGGAGHDESVASGSTGKVSLRSKGVRAGAGAWSLGKLWQSRLFSRDTT